VASLFSHVTVMLSCCQSNFGKEGGLGFCMSFWCEDLLFRGKRVFYLNCYDIRSDTRFFAVLGLMDLVDRSAVSGCYRQIQWNVHPVRVL